MVEIPLPSGLLQLPAQSCSFVRRSAGMQRPPVELRTTNFLKAVGFDLLDLEREALLRLEVTEERQHHRLLEVGH